MNERTQRWLLLVPMLAIALLPCGCSDDEVNILDPPCSGSEINNYVQPGNVEVLIGKTYRFQDGRTLHPELADRIVDVTFEAFVDPLLTMTLVATGGAATMEATLGVCRVLSDPACLFEFSLTSSSFAAGSGPQDGELLLQEDWRYHARLSNCTGTVTTHFTIENTKGSTSMSDVVELPGDSFCPNICGEP